MNAAFDAIKALLVPYAKHFKVWHNGVDTYDLEEDLPYSRTMFGYVHASRTGAHLLFYPLNVFPELRDNLPRSLASKLKSKYVLAFPTVTPADRAALAKLFAAAWQRIAAQRALNPDRAYYRKLDLQQTFDAVTKLFAGSPHQVTLHKHHVAVELAPGTKLQATLRGKATKSGMLKLKTITPAEHAALGALVAKRRK